MQILQLSHAKLNAMFDFELFRIDFAMVDAQFYSSEWAVRWCVLAK